MSKSPIQIVILKMSPFNGVLPISPCPVFPGVGKFSVALRSLFINGSSKLFDSAADLGINVSIGTGQCNHSVTAASPPSISPSTILDSIPLNFVTLTPSADAISYQNSDCYNSRMLFTSGSQSLSLTTIANNTTFTGSVCQATLCFYEEPISFSNFSIGKV